MKIPFVRERIDEQEERDLAEAMARVQLDHERRMARYEVAEGLCELINSYGLGDQPAVAHHSGSFDGPLGGQGQRIKVTVGANVYLISLYANGVFTPLVEGP